MKRYFFKVIPRGQEWIVKMDGITVNTCPTKVFAEEQARILASENRPSILLVRHEDGSLEYAQQFDTEVLIHAL